MATILSDKQLKSLLGCVIVDGTEACIRPNSYVLRLGSQGEFLNTGKEFEIGTKKKGIILPPGNSVGLTSYETLDFRREKVHSIFPGKDLHGIISPTTDLSREGIVAPSTQIDAGYNGTLNWTLTNTSSEERRFLYNENLFRLTIFLLEEGEVPEKVYSGDYQSQLGYVRSKRRGAPAGMKESEWENAYSKGGPEDLLENLIKTGYPWNILGKRLQIIDGQFKEISDEYSAIQNAMEKLRAEMSQIKSSKKEISETVREVLRGETDSIQNRWILGAGGLIAGFLGLVLAIISNQKSFQFMERNGEIIGPGLLIISLLFLYFVFRRHK